MNFRKQCGGKVTVEDKKLTKTVLFQIRPYIDHSSISEEVIKILGWNSQYLEFFKAMVHNG